LRIPQRDHHGGRGRCRGDNLNRQILTVHCSRSRLSAGFVVEPANEAFNSTRAGVDVDFNSEPKGSPGAAGLSRRSAE
jgi:hypothetical protein